MLWELVDQGGNGFKKIFNKKEPHVLLVTTGPSWKVLLPGVEWELGMLNQVEMQKAEAKIPGDKRLFSIQKWDEGDKTQRGERKQRSHRYFKIKINFKDA